jgi:outer membrane lipoprotein-sorting protein
MAALNHQNPSSFCRKIRVKENGLTASRKLRILVMKSILVFSLLFIANFSSPAYAKGDPEERGLEIAEMCDKASRGFKGEDSAMKMDIITGSGDKIFRTLEMKKKEVRDGERIIMHVESPQDVKGTKLLTWTHKTEDDEQWLYLPSMKRVKRISAQLKSGSFMGSEFAYEDFSQKEVSKFKHRFLKEEKLNGRPAWVVQRVTKKEESGYSKEIIWYDQEYKAPIKTEFYDRKKELLKTASMSDFKKYNDRWWRPTRIKMVNSQTRNQSILTWDKRKMKARFPDDLFKSENLKD